MTTTGVVRPVELVQVASWQPGRYALQGAEGATVVLARPPHHLDGFRPTPGDWVYLVKDPAHGVSILPCRKRPRLPSDDVDPARIGGPALQADGPPRVVRWATLPGEEDRQIAPEARPDRRTIDRYERDRAFEHKLSEVDSPPKFAAMLRDILEESGRTAGVVAVLTGLPRSTCYRYVSPSATGLPRDRANLAAFLQACRVQESQITAVLNTWQRLAYPGSPTGTDRPDVPARESGSRNTRQWMKSEGDDREGADHAFGLRAAAADSKFEQAIRHYRHALQQFNGLGLRAQQADVHRQMGRLEIVRGRFRSAERHFHTALGVFQELGDLEGVAEVHCDLGELAGRQAVELMRNTVDSP
ncbi:hypothetical protein [Nocardia goodfellowii]|uniref:Tetratricopeptide repeat protein n=1 Tax=Nocardia goodfellowii TaxID=882446 RepID=A0ABS4QPH0_9NOCA|nr:hypothetical protein [Nocardia goodfellowii]MBP2193604.1 hypothetical protein [Nocardia goodfellowii]